MPLSPFGPIDRWLAPAPDPGRADWIGEHRFAHRGLHDALVPENSPAAFARAIARGMGIECDIQRSADGEAMVFHDWSLDRLTGETGLEYDLSGGVRPNLGPFALDLGLVRYGYSRQPETGRLDFTEAKLLTSIPLGPATFGAGVYHAAHYFGRLGPATYYEINAASQIPRTRFSVSGAVGRQEISRAPDYSTWNLGVGYAATDRLGFDLRYWDTGRHALGDNFGSRVVFGLKAGF